MWHLKLVVAVVQDHDVGRLLHELIKKGHRATKLASTGGFLREGNTTVLMGVEEPRVDDVLEIIRETCADQNQLYISMTHVGTGGEQVPFPVEVPPGGAIVFVLDVERYVKF